MNILEQHTKLQNQLSDLKEQNARTEGKIESLKSELLQRGFDTIEKAVRWLGNAKQEQVELEEEIQDKLSEANELMGSIK